MELWVGVTSLSPKKQKKWRYSQPCYASHRILLYFFFCFVIICLVRLFCTNHVPLKFTILICFFFYFVIICPVWDWAHVILHMWWVWSHVRCLEKASTFFVFVVLSTTEYKLFRAKNNNNKNVLQRVYSAVTSFKWLLHFFCGRAHFPAQSSIMWDPAYDSAPPDLVLAPFIVLLKCPKCGTYPLALSQPSVR